jgi:hypothetical protein
VVHKIRTPGKVVSTRDAIPTVFSRGQPFGENAPVSLDIFLQGFESGDGASGLPDEANRVLQPYLRVRKDGFAKVVTDDGDAEVYGVGTDGVMFTHASGRRVWDVILEVARAGNWVIMPVGCPTCVPTASMIAELPDDLRAEAVVVNSGADLLDVVRRS